MHRAALHVVEIRDNEWWSAYVSKDARLGKAISPTTDYPTTVAENNGIPHFAPGCRLWCRGEFTDHKGIIILTPRSGWVCFSLWRWLEYPDYKPGTPHTRRPLLKSSTPHPGPFLLVSLQQESLALGHGQRHCCKVQLRHTSSG